MGIAEDIMNAVGDDKETERTLGFIVFRRSRFAVEWWPSYGAVCVSLVTSNGNPHTIERACPEDAVFESSESIAGVCKEQ